MQYLNWNIDAGLVRFILRGYFLIILFLLSIIGRQVGKCAAKVELLKNKPVSLHRMTGWLHANDIGIVIWKLHRLPGGWWLGTMMITTSILSVISDLLVTKLINPTLLPALCNFDQGLVVNWDTLSWVVPPPNGYPKLIASNAQLPLSDVCLPGIYRKVPQEDDWYFCAGDDDIYGGWDCFDMDKDEQWPSSTDLETIGTWLFQSSLQYANGSVNSDNAGSTSTHEVFWSSSAPTDSSSQPFDVLVSVDMNSSYSDTKTFKTFFCNVTASRAEYQDGLNKILSKMESMSTIEQWIAGLQGVVYMGSGSVPSADLKPNLEQYLNTMTMVEGGSNNVFSTTPDGDPPYYGCLTSQAEVHPIIPLLVGFAGFIFLVTLIYYFMLLTKLSTHFVVTKYRPNSNVESRANIKPVPDSTLSWMLQAARENALETEQMSTGNRDVKRKPVGGIAEETRIMSESSVSVPSHEYELRDWKFEVVDMPAGIARVVRRHGKAVASVMGSPQQPQQEVPQYVGSAFSPNSYQQPEMGMSTQQQQRMMYGANGYAPNIYEQQNMQ